MMPQTSRRVLVANWKMNKTCVQAIDFLEAFIPQLPSLPTDVEIVIAAPFTALAAMRGRLGVDHRIKLGAQNVHPQPSGAYTGEISIPMLQELGVTHVIVGHSERRLYSHETDADINAKTRVLLAADLTPIVAVGESSDERDASHTIDRVVSQTRGALYGLIPDAVARTILAYEPIWAIGTGRNCAVADAAAAMAAIRGAVDGLAEVPILYGGSMKPENVREYLAARDINGGLVGGAALAPESFAEMIRHAA